MLIIRWNLNRQTGNFLLNFNSFLSSRLWMLIPLILFLWLLTNLFNLIKPQSNFFDYFLILLKLLLIDCSRSLVSQSFIETWLISNFRLFIVFDNNLSLIWHHFGSLFSSDFLLIRSLPLDYLLQLWLNRIISFRVSVGLLFRNPKLFILFFIFSEVKLEYFLFIFRRNFFISAILATQWYRLWSAIRR